MTVVNFESQESAWRGHQKFAIEYIKQLQPNLFVELGVYRGDSFFAFAQGAKEDKLPTRLIGVDSWEGDDHCGHYEGLSIYEGLCRYRDEYYGTVAHVELWRTRFDSAAEDILNNSVDLLHIDGFHAYESVRHDFETWFSKLSNNAVVLFHDTMVEEEKGFGVGRYFGELSRLYPNYNFTHSHGLGILAVGSNIKENVFFNQIEVARLLSETPLPGTE